jgi:hypothetical protein
MNCNKECKECNHLDNSIITIDNQGGIIPHKRYIKGVKCNKYGQNAYSTLTLQSSTMGDYIVYK